MKDMLIWMFIAFALGSIPFSVLVGKLFLKKDIRQFGDGNPGGFNAWKAGGWKVGLPVVLCDVFKGFLPVYFASISGINGWELLPVSLAPIIGHAWSPFLCFRGGKAIATSLGIWLALSGFTGIIVFAIFTLLTLALQIENAWTTIIGMSGLTSYLFFTHQHGAIVWMAFLNLCILLIKHRKELMKPLQARDWIRNIFPRKLI